MQEENKAMVGRRSLLRRVGTVAAGVGAATAAGAMAAEPASANAEPLVQGPNTVTPTSFTGGTSVKAPLTLENTAGAPLTLKPMEGDRLPNTTAESGSVFMDKWGDLYTIGNDPEYPRAFRADVYSDNWAKITYPITPYRYLVTLPNFTMPGGAKGRQFVVAGSAKYDSAGRVLPKNKDNVPDLVLDFNPWFNNYYGFAAMQGNLSVMSSTKDGWISLYNSDVWPGTASLSFRSGVVSDNFAQSRLNPQQHLNIKLSVPAVIVLDIVGFITNNPYRALNFESSGTGPLSADARSTDARHLGPEAEPTPRLR